MRELLRRVARPLQNAKAALYDYLREPLTVSHHAYGVALSLYIIASSLHACSTLGVGFFTVVRRVSHYVVTAEGGYSVMLASLASFLLLITPVLWRRATRPARAAMCAIPASAVVMLSGTLGFTGLLVGLGLSFLSSIYMLSYFNLIYKGFTWGWSATVAVSAVATVLRTLGFSLVPRLTIMDYLLGVLQHVSPYLLLALAASPLAVGVASLLRSHKRPREQGRNAPAGELRLVACSALLSTLLYIVPYTAAVNPRGMVATTDILVYVDLLERMKVGEDPLATALTLRYGDRFLYLLLLYSVQRLTGVDSWTISTVSGWAWAPLLTASVWYATKRFFGSTAALHAALLSPLSAQLLGFIYGGFQANHLNLAILFFGMALLGEKDLFKKLLGAALVSVSPGVHMWSYVHVIPGLFLWSLMRLVRKRDRESAIRFVLLLAACSISLLAVTRFVSSLDHIGQVLEGWFRALALSGEIVDKISGLSLALAVYVWGSLNSPVLYLAGIGGQVVRLARGRSQEMTPLDYTMVITFAALLLLSPDIHLVSRLVLNVPLQIYAGILSAEATKETKTLIYSTTAYTSLYMVLNAPP